MAIEVRKIPRSKDKTMIRRLLAALLVMSAMFLLARCSGSPGFVFEDRTDLAVRYPALHDRVRNYFRACAEADVEALYGLLDPESKAQVENYIGGKRPFVEAVRAGKSKLGGYRLWGVLGNLKSAVIRELRETREGGQERVCVIAEVKYRGPNEVVSKELARRGSDWEDTWIRSGNTWFCSRENTTMLQLYFTGFISVWDPGFSFLDECNLIGKYPELAKRLEQWLLAFHKGDLSRMFDFMDPHTIEELEIGPRSEWVRWNLQKEYAGGFVHNLKIVRATSFVERHIGTTLEVEVTLDHRYWREIDERQYAYIWVLTEGGWYLKEAGLTPTDEEGRRHQRGWVRP
jgi:hypothetical protein